ncbi:DUF4398 domain-containing protein [Pseudomarimonas arenosa]|uniref:DUF4398 domain-containing protein n=1 Tax=Pseudomarimonas arenosa TaxID=2774145 RepID=A0AAW3ZJP0_9GAMM|nr:DUF4398 domain-containing protein [Pseudomarimonas arenosa]MBD8524917.1 DUF4398 domain-containing protein [Pseudomarimonas arenosa]
MLVGCASTPPPTSELNAAQSAVAQARAARAADHAPVEFGFAEEKLQTAKQALDQRQNDRARSAAEQAQVDAELALAKSKAADARARVKEKTEANARLRRELLGDNQ